MALDPLTERTDRGFVRDLDGRLIGVPRVGGGSGLSATEHSSGGFIRDDDGRLVVVLGAGATAATFSNGISVPDTSATASKGVTFGTDTNLYRSAADTLKTDDSLVVGGTLTVTGAISGNNSFAGAVALASTTGTGYIEQREGTTPTTPAADRMRLFTEDNGSGKTRLVVMFSDGVKIFLATQA